MRNKSQRHLFLELLGPECQIDKASLVLSFIDLVTFYGNYSTFDSRTNTVISHTFACSSRWRRKPWQVLLFLYDVAKVARILIFMVISKRNLRKKKSQYRVRCSRVQNKNNIAVLIYEWNEWRVKSPGWDDNRRALLQYILTCEQ